MSRRVLLLVGVLVVVAWAVRSGYLDAVADWRVGTLKSDATVWPFTLMWWARIGKLLQFLAGLAVVIDLLDTDRLRRAGQRAGERMRRVQSSLTSDKRGLGFADLHSTIYHALIEVQVDVYGATPTLFRSTRPPPDFGAAAPFTDEDYDRLQRRVFASGVGADGERITAAQSDKISTEVDRFLREHLSADDQELLDRAQRRRSRLLTAAGLVLLGGLVMLFMTDWNSAAVMVYAGLLCGWIAVLALGSELVLAVLWTRELPAYLAGTAGVRLLDRARPLHVFRKIALVLFIVGFQFDLLAS